MTYFKEAVLRCQGEIWEDIGLAVSWGVLAMVLLADLSEFS